MERCPGGTMIRSHIATSHFDPARENLWTDKWVRLEQFSRKLAADEDAGSIRLASWRTPDAAIVWYADRDVFVATAFRDHLRASLEPREADRRWRRWLDSANPPLVIIGEMKKDADDLADLGFQPTVRLSGPAADWFALFTRPSPPATP